MAKHPSPPLKITIGSDDCLAAQDVLAQQGVPLNITQSVQSLLKFAIAHKRQQLQDQQQQQGSSTQ